MSDDAGFTLAVPEGWDRSESKQGVFYTSPDESSLIQIFTITEPDTTPLESLRVAADSLSTSLSKDGYEQSSLEATSAPEGASDVVTDDAAELVYSYDSEKLGARRKVVDFSFTAQDGTQYAVLVAGPESEWPGQRDRLATALSRFAQGERTRAAGPAFTQRRRPHSRRVVTQRTFVDVRACFPCVGAGASDVTGESAERAFAVLGGHSRNGRRSRSCQCRTPFMSTESGAGPQQGPRARSSTLRMPSRSP